MYFQNFPSIYYEYDIGGQRIVKVVKDITINVRVQKQLLENISLYDEYDIKDGETPEIISARIYGSPLYHWVILMINQRYDYINEWPLNTNTLLAYVAAQYDDPNDIHHYETEDGFIVSSDYPGAIAVTNFQYEDFQNEKKRRIKLISPDYLGVIMSQLRGLI